MDPLLYSIKGIAILDNDGNRILAKYYDDTFSTVKEQKAFEKNLFSKTHSANAEIILLDGMICVYRSNVDLFFYVMGSSNENELILMNVLNCLYDAASQILRKNVEKRALLDNMDVIMLAVDEVCDGGIILESDPTAIVSRVAVRAEDAAFTEQSVAQKHYDMAILDVDSVLTHRSLFFRSQSLRIWLLLNITLLSIVYLDILNGYQFATFYSTYFVSSQHLRWIEVILFVALLMNACHLSWLVLKPYLIRFTSTSRLTPSQRALLDAPVTSTARHAKNAVTSGTANQPAQSLKWFPCGWLIPPASSLNWILALRFRRPRQPECFSSPQSTISTFVNQPSQMFSPSKPLSLSSASFSQECSNFDKVPWQSSPILPMQRHSALYYSPQNSLTSSSATLSFNQTGDSSLQRYPTPSGSDISAEMSRLLLEKVSLDYAVVRESSLRVKPWSEVHSGQLAKRKSAGRGLSGFELLSKLRRAKSLGPLPKKSRTIESSDQLRSYLSELKSKQDLNRSYCLLRGSTNSRTENSVLEQSVDLQDIRVLSDSYSNDIMESFTDSSFSFAPQRTGIDFSTLLDQKYQTAIMPMQRSLSEAFGITDKPKPQSILSRSRSISRTPGLSVHFADASVGSDVSSSSNASILESPRSDVWLEFGIDSAALEDYVENLRRWLSKTVLKRVVAEINAVNAKLVQGSARSSDTLVGEMPLNSLHLLGSTTDERVAVASLLPFLELTTHQKYFVQRLRELADGSCIGEFRWNAGGTFNNQKWQDNLPTDTQILLHLLCVHLDFRLPPHPLYARTFTDQFVVQSPAKLKVGRKTGVLYQANASPPHFQFVVGDPRENRLYDVGRGRNNFFHTLLLFFKYYVNSGDGIGGIELGKAGLDVKQIFED